VVVTVVAVRVDSLLLAELLRPVMLILQLLVVAAVVAPVGTMKATMVRRHICKA
jgi:hypothetical protein